MMSAPGLTERNEVRENLVRAVGARGQLPPQAQADVEPSPLPVGRFDERARLGTLVVSELVLELHEIVIAGILVAEEVQAALLYPVLPGRFVDLVRCGEDGIARRDHL